MSGPDPEDPTDPDLRAAEYALGTLSAGERASVELEAVADPEMRTRVQAWERRLAPLMTAVPDEMPPPRVRAALLRSLPSVEQEHGTADARRVVQLRAQVRRWRFAAVGAGLLAAGLALFVTVDLAANLRPQATRYLAVVQDGGALPALIVSVDTAAGTATVRPVGAEAPAGRSLELWYVGAGGPKALGLVGTAPSRVALPPGASADGVIAVSVEPPGGSPSGQPTGPVLYTGKLIAE